MAKRIKGITVEIGGDTTKLSTALKSVNGQIKNTQAQLKDVERLLKLDPSNTELLAQKQKLLNDAIKDTKSKFDTLKIAAQQANEQLTKGQITQEQYDALQRELMETSNELKKLEKQASTTRSSLVKISEVGSSFQKSGKAITDVGKKVGVASTAVSALGIASVKTAADFESSMSQVQATMGITKDSMSQVNGESVNIMETLSNLAKQMGSETAFSASQCADALNYLALAGYDTKQMMDTLPLVLNLAAAGNIELASASDMVTDAMSALGLETDQAGIMVDQMAKTASTTNTSVAQLGEGILTIGATAKTLKGGTAELNTALGILANNGIKAAEGGTHLRNMILALQSPTEEASNVFDELGISVFDSEGNMRALNDVLSDLNNSMAGMSEEEKANIISKMFNKTDLAAVNSLLANTGDAWNKLQTNIQNSGGAAQQMADTQLDNLKGQLTILKSAIEGLAISIGESLMPLIKQIAEKIQEFVDWMNGLDASTKNVIVGVGLFIVALGPALIILGTLIEKIGSIMSLFGKLVPTIMKCSSGIGAMMGKLGAAIGAINPVVAGVVALITVLVGSFISLWKNNEEFRNNIIAIWESIKESFSNFSNGIVERLNALGIDFEKFKEIVTAIWNGLCSFLAPIFEGTFQQIANFIDATLNTILSLLDVFIGIFTGNWDQCWEGIKNFIGSIWNGIVSIFTTQLNTIKNVANVVLGWFGTSWDNLWNEIKETFSSIWNSIVSFFTTTWENIKNILTVGIMMIQSLLQAAFDIITLPFQFIWENCKDFLMNVWNSMKDFVSKTMNDISSIISSILSFIKNIFKAVWNGIYNFLASILHTIYTTISSVFDSIKTTASNIWNGVMNTITTIVSTISNTVSSVITSMRNTISSVFDGIKTIVSNVWSSIKNAIITPIREAKDTVKGFVDSIAGFFKGLKISLPKIKLPHFKIKGGFSIVPPKVPKLSIDWYKKAMNKPMLLNGATIFGQSGNRLLGGGEAGPEVIMGLDALQNMTAGANKEMVYSMNQMFHLMQQYFPMFASTSVTLDSGELVGAMAPQMDVALGQLAMKKERGW